MASCPFFWEGYRWSAGALLPLLQFKSRLPNSIWSLALAIKSGPTGSARTPNAERPPWKAAATYASGLPGGGAGDSLFEQALQFFGVAGGRQAGVAGADEGAGFVFGEMRQCLAQGDG
jgi:hypothetical protein